MHIITTVKRLLSYRIWRHSLRLVVNCTGHKFFCLIFSKNKKYSFYFIETLQCQICSAFVRLLSTDKQMRWSYQTHLKTLRWGRIWKDWYKTRYSGNHKMYFGYHYNSCFQQNVILLVWYIYIDSFVHDFLVYAIEKLLVKQLDAIGEDCWRVGC